MACRGWIPGSCKGAGRSLVAAGMVLGGGAWVLAVGLLAPAAAALSTSDAGCGCEHPDVWIDGACHDDDPPSTTASSTAATTPAKPSTTGGTAATTPAKPSTAGGTAATITVKSSTGATLGTITVKPSTTGGRTGTTGGGTR